MKIAVDVMGTIEGPKKDRVLSMIRGYLSEGHEVTIWSSSLFLASQAVVDNKLSLQYVNKFSKSDVDFDQNEYFDIAIEDDRSQDYLAAKKFIWVDEL